MGCSLKNNGSNWTARTGGLVTLKLIAANTVIATATYNNQELSPENNTVHFTVVSGQGLLLLSLAGPPEALEVVEDCGGGISQHIFGYPAEFHPVLGFSILGEPYESILQLGGDETIGGKGGFGGMC